MSNIKVSILGSDGYVCQIPRIKEGMEALGHVLSDESPDLIYSNDPTGYKKALSLKKKYTKAYYASNFLKAKNKLNQILKPKDTVVFMGAGSISSWCNDYAKQFKLEDLNVK